MMVEHSFVTTLSETEAMHRGAEFLAHLGFKSSINAGQLPQTLRPGAGLERFKPIIGLPRQIRLEFDRGRITAAASIEPRGKAINMYKDMLLAIVTGLERKLALGEPDESAATDWTRLMHQLEARRRRDQRFKLIALAISGAVILTLIIRAVRL
jgi:hypothetical protein